MQTEHYTARKYAALSILINLFLAIFKGVAGIAANSPALLSDAIHSATDVLASASAYIGIWVAEKKHPSYPYGLYKAETIATLVIAMAVLIAAYEIGKHAFLGPASIPQVGL
ncbi:MAG: cation diffusion facilitator family transporter, partial [Thermodesulfobacteriota bacterium]